MDYVIASTCPVFSGRFNYFLGFLNNFFTNIGDAPSKQLRCVGVFGERLAAILDNVHQFMQYVGRGVQFGVPLYRSWNSYNDEGTVADKGFILDRVGKTGNCWSMTSA